MYHVQVDKRCDAGDRIRSRKKKKRQSCRLKEQFPPFQDLFYHFNYALSPQREILPLSRYTDPKTLWKSTSYQDHIFKQFETSGNAYLFGVVQTLHVVILGGNAVGRLLSVGVALCWVLQRFWG